MRLSLRLLWLLLPVMAAPGSAPAQDKPPAEIAPASPAPPISLDALMQRFANRPKVPIDPLPGTEKLSIESNGVTRTYLRHFSQGTKPEKPAPLVLVLHGAGGDGAIMEHLTGMSTVADERGFTVLYPDATPEGGPGIWDFWSSSPRAEPGRDDVGFLRSLLDLHATEGIADGTRLYAAGISNGAFMTNRLAIDLGDRLAAIGAVAGTAPKVAAAFLSPPQPMPVIYFHGSADRLVGIDGTDFLTRGRNSLSAAEYAAWWAAKNGCPSPPVMDALPDTSLRDGCTVERKSWAAPPGGAPVVYYRVEGGGHTWPGGSPLQKRYGPVCEDINASELMWGFFSQHARRPGEGSGQTPR